MKKISKVLFESSKEETDALIERGNKQLSRLGILIDVLFALMIYKMFTFLPRPEIDGFTRADLVEVLSTSYLNYLVMFVGFVLILIYWGQSNLQFGNLVRTDGRHAALSILQVISLMIYLYFVRLDVEFEGAVIALQLESVFLAISGFLGLWSWHYAIRNKLISDKLSKEEQSKVYLKLTPEPVVSVLSFPFAIFGPDIWTLSWLLLIPVGYIAKRLRSKIDRNNISQ
jgi:uncharacterized membrane protein